MQFREKLAKRAKRAGISLPEALVSGLEAYFELLRKWNRRVALTALPIEAGGDEAFDRLLIEPLVASKFLSQPAGTVIDVGTGGGSPAIPLKLANPGLSLRMVESKTRKSAFLREAIRELSLEDTEVETVRLEELLQRASTRESADVVTMRAVKPDKSTLRGVAALLKPQGAFLLFRTSNKGRRTSPEETDAPGLLYRSSQPLLPSLHSELAIYTKKARSG